MDLGNSEQNYLVCFVDNDIFKQRKILFEQGKIIKLKQLSKHFTNQKALILSSNES
jgi:hypothetical protein